MTFGLFATPIAYLNMQRAKRRYEEALKKSEELAELRAEMQKKIDAYENQKSILDDIRTGVQQDGAAVAAPLPGLQMAYTLRVGKLGGKNMSAQIILKLKNGSNKIMRLTAFQFMGLKTVNDIPFTDYNPCYVNTGGVYKLENGVQTPIQAIELNPGAGCELEVGSIEAYPVLSKDNLVSFRNWLADLAGKKLYSSIPSERLFPKAITSDTFGVCYIYQRETGEWISSQSLFKNVVGHIEYMGITWMPIDLGIGKIILLKLLSALTFGSSDAIREAAERDKNGMY